MAQAALKPVVASLCLPHAESAGMSLRSQHLSLSALSDGCERAHLGQGSGVLEPSANSL